MMTLGFPNVSHAKSGDLDGMWTTSLMRDASGAVRRHLPSAGAATSLTTQSPRHIRNQQQAFLHKLTVKNLGRRPKNKSQKKTRNVLGEVPTPNRVRHRVRHQPRRRLLRNRTEKRGGVADQTANRDTGERGGNKGTTPKTRTTGQTSI